MSNKQQNPDVLPGQISISDVLTAAGAPTIEEVELEILESCNAPTVELKLRKQIDMFQLALETSAEQYHNALAKLQADNKELRRAYTQQHCDMQTLKAELVRTAKHIAVLEIDNQDLRRALFFDGPLDRLSMSELVGLSGDFWDEPSDSTADDIISDVPLIL